MGHHDERHADLFLDVRQLELRLFTQFFVKRRQRLIKQQQFRLLDQRACQRDPLALTAGQLLRLAFLVILKFHQFQNIMHPVGNFRLRYFVLLQAESDVLFHAHVRKQRVALKHHIGGALICRHRRHVGAVDGDGARLRKLETRQHAQQGGLATTRSAQQAE